MSEHKAWPAWYFGPGDKSEIFEAASEVPKGWVDHPSKVGGEAKAAKPVAAPSTNETPTPVTPDTETVQLDADGHAWDAEIHAASKSMTKAGLWRMKVGASRPAPVSSQPLDL